VRKTGRIHFAVEFEDDRTDIEDVAMALEKLLETAMSTPGILEDYGLVDVGEFLCAETDTVLV
jgi:hypothetical protein